ncbi:MAG: flagellar hook-associated protein FlgK [Hyphomonas sp.]
MGLSSAISAAKSGLQASSLRAEIAASNVANATTPGYVRRSVTLSESMLGGQSNGVTANGVSRPQDVAVKAARRELTSDVAQANVLASTWQSISSRIGDAANGNGLFKTFSDFETALSRAVATPESSSSASALLTAARNITSELKSLSGMVSTQRSDADREIAEGVSAVNSALKQVETLNNRLAGANRNSPEAAALLDERQRILDAIAEYIPVQAIEREYGKIDIMTPEGVFLLAGNARTIEFTPTPTFGASQTRASGDLSGISVDGVDITPGASSFGAVSSGMLGALFTLRDQELTDLNDQLDTIASDLIGRLSDDAIDPTKTPGDPGLFVDTDPGAGAGLAGRISLNAAVDPQQGGAVWRLRDGLGAAAPGNAGNQSILKGLFDAFTAVQSVSTSGFQGGYSATGMAAQIASLAGQARVSHEAALSSSQAQFVILLEAERSATGVNIDSQMQDLLLIEQAYAANARVIEVAGKMINTLLEF